MILDTTYLLPVAGLDVDTDILTLIYDGKLGLSLDDIKISLISLFELQAIAAKKYKLPPSSAIDAVDIITSTLKVEPFHGASIIKIADVLSRKLKDYVDCLILATAISLKEDLVTEDSKIRDIKGHVTAEYGIKILSYQELVTSSR